MKSLFLRHSKHTASPIQRTTNAAEGNKGIFNEDYVERVATPVMKMR